MNPYFNSAFKLLTRNKQSWYFSFVVPVVLVVIFGLVSGEATVLGGEITYKDFVMPGLVALALLQLSVFSIAFVITQYRDKGILKKLLTTPMSVSRFIGGEITARLIIAVIQALLLVAVAILFFEVTVRGSFLLFILLSILGALVFLALGFVIAGLSKTIESVPVFANMIVLPMIFLGDVFFPIESLPGWLHGIANLMPIRFLAEGLRLVMLEGAGALELWSQFLGLFAWLLIFFFLAKYTFTFKVVKI